MATDKIKVAVRVRPFNRRGLYLTFLFVYILISESSSSEQASSSKEKPTELSLFLCKYWISSNCALLWTEIRKTENLKKFRVENSNSYPRDWCFFLWQIGRPLGNVISKSLPTNLNIKTPFENCWFFFWDDVPQFPCSFCIWYAFIIKCE